MEKQIKLLKVCIAVLIFIVGCQSFWLYNLQKEIQSSTIEYDLDNKIDSVKNELTEKIDSLRDHEIEELNTAMEEANNKIKKNEEEFESYKLENDNKTDELEEKVDLIIRGLRTFR